ncbi:BspA family leucine-rich repeat surface protein [bacterium SCSIO 12643]|nr:BspA family leucine-rich repeat surface protein [bacterium SCSIO 12643]
MKNFFTVKSYSFLALIAILAISLFSNSTAYTQTLASPYVVTTFPATISSINTAGGETATGMQGACFTLPCCSINVFKVTLPANGVLRVEMSNFNFLAGSIIAYRSLVANPTSYSDLQYISGSPGNFCGFRDTLQLGRAFTDNWDNIPYGGTPTQYSGITSVYDFNNPSSLAGYYPAGDYYLLVFNENQQTSQGLGGLTDLTFEFAEACAPLTAPTALNFDTLEYNSESDTVSFYVKNQRTLDVDIDTSNISITGTNASEFIFLPVSDTSLAVGDSLQFQVVFTPTSGGARTASIEIPFSDTSCSTTSEILLNGYGAQPEIVLLGNSINITNNDLTPSTSNFTNMGPVVTNTGSVTKLFQITNTGSDTLTLTNNPIVTLSGNSQFIISSQPASSVLPGDTTSFEITFTPTVDGTVTTDISIANNDLDESTFTFRIEATGAERNGLHFDGSNDYVNINTVADDMAGINTWTIESWIKADPSQTGNDHIMAVNTTGTGTIFLFRLDDGFLDFYDGSTAFEVGPDLRDDTWHHVAATYDNGQLSLFIDGIPQGSFNTGTISFASNNRWSLGQEYDGSSRSEYFKGALNEVRIWKTVKTTQEIADGRYCEIQNPASNTNLTGYYTFNQGVSGGSNTSINAITDASGYTNDGTPNNFALTGTTSNFIAATNVGVNCNSVRIALCDIDSYSVPGGNTYTSSGVYIDTLTNSMGGDSIVYTDLSIRYFQITQDHINDTTVCDTIKEFAQTSYTPFARFENTDNDWVEINGAVDSLVNTNRSVFLWMREADQISGSADVLVGINTSGTATVCNLGIATNEQLWIYDGGNNRYSGVVVTDGQWHFVGYTYDEASNQTQFWVDGVAANSFTNGQSISATSRISLGQEFDGSSPSNFYDGDMAEVTIWNEVLDATDIALLMESSVQTSHPKYNKLKAYYPMISECNNTDLTLKDFGPHAYNGTMTANDIIITDTLANLTDHNAAPLYSKSWIRNGSQISTSDSLFLTNAIQGGTYGLNLSLDYFNVSDSWVTTVNPACQGLFASVVVDAHVSCNGLSDGGATITGINGTAPYTFAWSNGATSASITSLSAGTYTVTVTDGLGDTSSTSISITEPTVLNANPIITSNISTSGASDGVASATPQGGTAPFTYLWSNGATTASISSLSAGTYTVTVTDANGCVNSGSVNFIAPVAPAPGVIVITEINYNPPESGSDSTEYIEIHNTSSAPVNLLGCKFTSGVVYTFPNISINAGGYLVIATDSVALNNRFGIHAYQWSSGGLSNGGEPIAIKDPSNNLIDSLRYDDVAPWPTSPDGNGTTLVLCNPSADNTDGTNWSASTTILSGVIVNSKQVYGSPGIADDVCSGIIASATANSNVSCNGLSNGAAMASATGGTTPYTYSWNTGATTASITGISAGTYSVTVTDNMGSTDSTSITITEPSALISSATITSAIDCNGATNGQTTASATGGTAPYTYTWNTGTSTSSVTSLGAGTYSVTVSDQNGCTDSSSISLTQPSGLSISATSGTDSIDISIAGGTTPYNFIWSNGATIEDLNNIPSGTYTVTITDGNGCTDTHTENVVNPAEYFVTTWKTDNPGVSDSTSINIYTQSGFSYNYDVDWNGDGVFDEFGITGDVTHDYGVAGTYTVKIKGDFPSIYFFNTSRDNEKLMSVEQWGNITWASMNRALRGCVNVVINATDAPDLSNVQDMSYMFLEASSVSSDMDHWDVSNVTNMTGMFQKATAFNGNITTWAVDSVTNMNSMFKNASAFNGNISTWTVDSVTDMRSMFREATAFNQNIGGWNVGSVVNMEFMFYNADAFTQDISSWDVSAVTNMRFMFALTNNFNQNINSWNVGAVSNLSAMFRDATAFNQPLNSWDVSSATNMQSMFQGSAFNQNISNWDVDSVENMSFMFYNNTAFNQPLDTWNTSSVTNMKSMFHNSESFNQDLNSWDVSSVTNMEQMFDRCDVFNGNISNWDVSSVTNMSSMFRSCYVFNSNISGWDVGSVTNMIAMFNQANNFDQNLGSWDVDSLATPNLMFLGAELSIDNYDSLLIGWVSQNVQFGKHFHGGYSKYCAGDSARQELINTFGWTITDGGKSCPPSVSISATNTSCNNVSDGTASASASGGTAPYNYLWNTGATNATINGLAAGIYSVTITDNSGITDSASVTITQPTALVSIVVVDSNTTCNGLSDGGATAAATGGTGPYTYTWSNGATNASITGVTADTYSVTLTDANGCTDSTSVTISEPALLVTTAVVDSNITCNGLSNGGATAAANGGSNPYAYTWSNGATNASITGVIAGTYSITITDNKGCTDSTSISITEPALLVATTAVDSNISCHGLTDGGTTVSATGGTGPYTYTWSNGATNASINGVPMGTYSVTVTDHNGCTDSSSVNITEPALLVSTSVVDSNISCNGSSDGGATATANGGSSSYTYSWSNATHNTSITGVPTGTYSVTVTDLNGCMDSSSVIITEPTPLVTTTVVDSNTTCSSNMDGGATASATGGTSAYSYSWNNSAITASITGVAASTYTVTITDANGCSDVNTIHIIVEDTIRPVVLTQNIDAYLDMNGNSTISTADIDNGSSDACGIQSMQLDITSFDCSNLGSNTVELLVTDVNGNSDSTTAIVTVIDSLAPTINGQNINAYLNSSGQVSITASDIDNGSVDNCGIASTTISTSNFTCAEIGSNNVDLIVEDVNGNIDTATYVVTVLDTVSPVVNTSNTTVYLDALGQASITVADINNNSTDNCGIQTMTLDSVNFDCSEVGINTVVLTVSDVNGNSSTQSATVTVADTNSPTAIAQDYTAYLDANGSITISVNDIDNGSSDNCGILSMTLDQYTFTCADTGTNTVILEVNDVNGNSYTASAVVTVIDTLKPTVTSQDINVYLDANGQVSISTSDIDNGSTDNCTIQNMTLDNSSFDCSAVGVNTVILSVTDVNGNTDTASATVTVIDSISPAVSTQDITVYLDATGISNISTSDIDNGSTDNCAIQSQSLDISTFNCSDLGTNTVTLSVTDVNGNTNTQTAVVTVMDSITPKITCPTDFSNCGPEITVDDPVVSDNCNITLQLVSGIPSGETFPVGKTTNTYEVIDVSGNKATCSVDITRFPQPVVTVRADSTVYYEQSLTLYSQSEFVVEYQWSPSIYLNSSTSQQPICTPQETTEYTLIGKSADGCYSEPKSVYITVYPGGELLIPNTFSPNGDGYNDYFEIPGIAFLPEMRMTIFNRNGEILYQKKGYQNDWDGTSNGKVLPVATYYYVIDLGNNQEPIKGDITIIK